MKKPLKFLLIGVVLLLISCFVTLEIISFEVIKPTTENINKKFGEYFSRVVMIPEGINAPTQSFSETVYFWDMETVEKEVTRVEFRHDSGFSNKENIIRATLELAQGSDPSIFNKVLAAVIADRKSLYAAQNPDKADLSASPDIGYNKINLEVKPETGQVVRISWEFEKSALGDDIKELYQKLSNFPDPLLRIEYVLLLMTISILGGG